MKETSNNHHSSSSWGSNKNNNTTATTTTSASATAAVAEAESTANQQQQRQRRQPQPPRVHKFVYSTKLDFETFSLIAAADAAAKAELCAADADGSSAHTKGGGNTLRMSHLPVCLPVCVYVFNPRSADGACLCVCASTAFVLVNVAACRHLPCCALALPLPLALPPLLLLLMPPFGLDLSKVDSVAIECSVWHGRYCACYSSPAVIVVNRWVTVPPNSCVMLVKF